MSDQERAKDGGVSVADVLRYLLDKVHPADRGPYSVPEVAVGSGVSESTLKALRSGRKDNPTLATLHDLAAFFGVPVEVFVSEHGPEYFLTRQRLTESMVDAGVMRIAMRAGGSTRTTCAS